jgi:hypothetical protein
MTLPHLVSTPLWTARGVWLAPYRSYVRNTSYTPGPGRRLTDQPCVTRGVQSLWAALRAQRRAPHPSCAVTTAPPLNGSVAGVRLSTELMAGASIRGPASMGSLQKMLAQAGT